MVSQGYASGRSAPSSGYSPSGSKGPSSARPSAPSSASRSGPAPSGRGPSSASSSAPAGTGTSAPTPGAARRSSGGPPPAPSPSGSSRPPTAKAVANKRPSGGSSAQVIRVSSNQKKDDIGIETLLGDYVEQGMNHGRKFYLKNDKIVGHEEVQVYLYYWDTRDGPDFTGWWFGDQVGGSQVWSRASNNGQSPPKEGWRIPWDGPVAAEGVIVVEPAPAAASEPPRRTPPAPPPAKAAPTAARSGAEVDPQAVSQRCEEVMSNAREAVASAKSVVGNKKATAAAVQQAEKQLSKQQAAVTAESKRLLQDIQTARTGKASQEVVRALSALSPRLRGVDGDLKNQGERLRNKLKQAEQQADDERRRREEAEKEKIAEKRDEKAFQDSLPEVMDLVTEAEDLVDTTGILAAPFSVDEDLDESETSKLDEVEESAQKASAALDEARKQVAQKLTDAKKYAPEARKAAMQELNGLQEKLTEASKKLNPLKRLKQDIEQKVAAKKAVQEVGEKLSEAELEVEKVHIMCTSRADDSQMPEDEIKSVDSQVGPAHTGISEAAQLIEKRLRNAPDAALKRELEAMQVRAKEAMKKTMEVRNVIKLQREGMQAQKIQIAVVDKVEQTEEAVIKTAEAEMPFLKGVEILPTGEATEAIAECEKAAGHAETAITSAKSFVNAKISEVKRLFSKETQKRVLEYITSQQEKLEGSAKKLATFKKETEERKAKAFVQDIIEKVAEAETQVAALVKICKPFATESLDEVSTESMQTTVDQAQVAEKDASDAWEHARKALSAKQKDAKGHTVIAELSKLQTRMNSANTDLSKSKRLAKNGERMLNAKTTLIAEEEKIQQAESEVSKMETLATPVGDERPSDETITQIDTAVSSAQTLLSAAVKSIDVHMSNAMAPLKAALSKLITRAKKGQEKLDAVKASTREQRERVMCEQYVTLAGAKTEDIEKSLEKVGELELPFLKGIEVLPLSEAAATIKNSEEAAEEVHKCIHEARTYVAGRKLEVRRFSETIAKKTGEDFSKLNERINNAAQKLAQFRKDTEARKRKVKLQEAQEKVREVQEEVRKTAEIAAPLLSPEDLDNLSQERATEVCKALVDQEKGARDKAEAALAFLAERKREAKGHTSSEEEVKKLESELKKIQVDLATIKTRQQELEQKFVATKLIEEAKELIAETEDAVEKASKTAEPLVTDGGASFLAANNALLLGQALRERMHKHAQTEDSLFKEFCGDGQSTAKKATVIAHLERLPELYGRDDLTFSEEQREAIFKYADADNDGELSVSEFAEICRERFICIRGISITEGFDISASKTSGKLELGEVVEALGPPQSSENGNLTRLQCREVNGGKTGWVTMKGNQGTNYFEPLSPYSSFTKAMERAFEIAGKCSGKASHFIKAKSSELASRNSGPLVEAKNELNKLRPKVMIAQKKIDDLVKKVKGAKVEYTKKEEAEQRSQQEMRDKKAAAVILKAVHDKFEIAEAAAEKLTTELKPLTADLRQLEAVAAPISLTESGDRLAKALDADIAVVREVVAEHTNFIGKANKGPMYEARQSIAKLCSKLASLEVNRTATLSAAKVACQQISTSLAAKAAASLRSEVQKRGLTYDALFAEIAGEGQEKISEEAFCQRLQNLDFSDEGGATLSPETARMVARHIEADGISRRSFLHILQQYYVCVKQIAVTSEFEIGQGKTNRMLIVNEVIEVLEGPKGDDKLGVSRVRGKALSDGLTGWISVKGNQGTPFLKASPKPFFSCAAEMLLEREFKAADGSEPVRRLKAEEVLEVLEGPRSDRLGNLTRAKVRACSDGVTGWFTIKGRDGESSVNSDILYYVCTAPIAMTDQRDIKQCKVVRKLEVGEVLWVLEGPITEQEAGVTRVRVRSTKDSATGWVTIKGNAGTIYAEESSKHRAMSKDVILQRNFSSQSDVIVRTLAADETVEVIEGPREEKFDAVVRLKGRALLDGEVGWVTFKDGNLKPWTPNYQCVSSTAIHNQLAISGAVSMRRLEVGELVDVLEGPAEDGSLGIFRIKGRAEKDGAVGWITLKGNQGKQYLECKIK